MAHFWKIGSKDQKNWFIKNVDYSLSCEQFKFASGKSEIDKADLPDKNEYMECNFVSEKIHSVIYYPTNQFNQFLNWYNCKKKKKKRKHIKSQLSSACAQKWKLVSKIIILYFLMRISEIF